MEILDIVSKEDFEKLEDNAFVITDEDVSLTYTVGFMFDSFLDHRRIKDYLSKNSNNDRYAYLSELKNRSHPCLKISFDIGRDKLNDILAMIYSLYYDKKDAFKRFEKAISTIEGFEEQLSFRGSSHVDYYIVRKDLNSIDFVDLSPLEKFRRNESIIKFIDFK